MHRTTSTNLTDALEQLGDFAERLEDARWMPTEELMGMLAAGVMVLDAMFKSTSPEMFMEEEIEFIDQLNERITNEINEISTSENYE